MALFLITLLGALFRFTNLNWDMGGRLHPDEALIVNGVLSIKFFSQMFPGFHDYNGFSVYLLKLFTIGIGNVETITVAGRFLSACFSTLTILIVYLIGRKLWNKRTGLIAAVLFACTPLSIQLAHFYTTESILVFLFTLLIYFSLSDSVLGMAIVSGLAIATKNTGFLFLPIPLFQTKHKLVFLCTTAACFFVFSPYSILDFHGYISTSRYISDVVSGKILMDWTMQFQQTNGLFWLPNLLYGFGLAGILGILGLLNKQKNTRIIALWTIGFMLFLAFTYLKFIRYSAPLIPLLSLFAAAFIIKTKLFPLIVLQLVWATMFFHIYLVPHTALLAAKVIPKNSRVLGEEWNSIIKYPISTFNIYTLPDSPDKMKKLNEAIQNADYFIMQSPKVKNTIMRLKKSYPYMNDFYMKLENGSLGFKKIAEFSSYPSLGPFMIDDGRAEETFTVFDHPYLIIYKKI